MSSVLIVEDDTNLRTSIENFLYDEGFEVLLAENGLAALKLMEITKPDLILSDIHMPVMDGFELSRKIKDNPDTALIPFLFLTSDTEIQKTTDCDILYKPFLFNDLHDLLNKKLALVQKRKFKKNNK